MQTKNLKILFILSLIIIGFLSCSHSNVGDKLRRAEKMMDGNPNADSARLILENINPLSLSSNRDKAMYALLMSQAKEKTDEIVTDDSLINIAVKYFSRHEELYYSMLSQYYLGRVKFNAEDYALSIVAMFKALDYAKATDNNFWAGMICGTLTDIYTNTYNSVEENSYAQKAYLYLKESGKQPYINYALLDVAKGLGNTGRHDEAISTGKECVDSAMKYNDQYLASEAKRTIAMSYLLREQYDKALPIYDSLCASSMSTAMDSAYLCYSHIGNNNISQAKDILNNLPELRDSMNCLLQYEIYSKLHDDKKALLALKNEYDALNRMFKTCLEMNVTNSAVDYLKQSREVAETERNFSQNLSWGIFIICVLVLVIIAKFVITYRNEQQLKIENNLQLAEQLQRMLSSREAEYSEARNSIKILLSSKYEVFDELCRLAGEDSCPENTRKRISATVTSLIKQMTGDNKMISDLENFVNSHCSNLMADFRADIPKMMENNYRLFLFSVLGFSDRSIAMFLQKQKVSQIYNIRRHLKDKIKKLEESKRKKYLDFL